MSASQNSYILSSGGFSANARTTLQHYLYKDGLDYLLHPTIPTREQNLKVAEIGVGTGIWMIELARTLSPAAQIDGLDISFDQCPPREWMPKNVSWITQNIFDEPPQELWEKYDIIHVQLFITIIRDGNPVPMLKNLLKMLKPGGYIQWGEWDFQTWTVSRTSSASSQDNNELEQIREYTSTLGGTKQGAGFIAFKWISRLDDIFREHGMEKVVVDRQSFADGIATLLLDTWMMASTEISINVLDKLGGGQGEIMREMISEVLKNRQNTTFNLDRVIVVGQKPFQ